MVDIVPAGDGGLSVTIGEEPLPELPADGGAPRDALPVIADDDAPRLPKRALLNPDGSVTLTLRTPVTVAYRTQGAATPMEERFAHLTFQRLTGAHMRRISDAERADQAVTAVGLSTGVRFALMSLVFDRMDAADVRAVSEVMGFFLDSGPTTGR